MNEERCKCYEEPGTAECPVCSNFETTLDPVVMRPVKLQTFIRNPMTTWYGPHQCNGCGATVVKSSIESGGVSLDAPHGHHYPNHKWTLHKCANGKAA